MNHQPLTEIVVGGDVLKITAVDTEEMANKEDGSHNDGEFTFHDSQIKVNEDCDHQGFFRVILHEAAHHHLCWGGLEGALRAFLTTDQAAALLEALCDTLASFTYGIMRDNPRFQEAFENCVKTEGK